MNRWLKTDLKINNQPLYITRLEGSEALSRPFSFTVDITCAHKHLNNRDFLGKALAVCFTTNQNQQRYFHGIIQHVKKLRPKHKSYGSYQITLRPSVTTLKLEKINRIFQHKSVVDIVTDIFNKNKIRDYQTDQLTRTYPKIEYCVQYNENSLEFIQRILATAGIFYTFIHNNNTHTIVFFDTNKSLQEITKSLEVNKPSHTISFVHSQQEKKQLQPGMFCSGDDNTLRPSQPIYHHLINKNKNNQQMYFHFPSNTQNSSETERNTHNNYYGSLANDNNYHASSNDSQLAAGKIFSFNTTASDKKYLITTIQHKIFDLINLDNAEEFNHHASDKNSTHQQSYQNHFFYINSTQEFKKKYPINNEYKFDHKNRQTAVVTGLDKNHVYTDALARIKIQFHWEKNNKNADKSYINQDSSCWCRVSQELAGNKRGTQWIPRVGDEVIVKFIYSEYNRPVITGSTYNSMNKIPYPTNKDNTITGIKTINQNSKAFDGHQLMVDDSINEEKINLNSSGRLLVKTKNNFLHNTQLADKIIIQRNGIVYSKTTTGEIQSKELHLFVGANSLIINSSGVTLKTVQSDPSSDAEKQIGNAVATEENCSPNSN